MHLPPPSLPPSPVPPLIHSFAAVLCVCVCCRSCAHCSLVKATDFDHMRPSLKEMTICSAIAVGQIKKELAATLSVVSSSSRRSAESATQPRRGAGQRGVYQAEAGEVGSVKKHKIGGVCTYEGCKRKEVVCTDTNIAAFDFDHLHPAACPCHLCPADPSLSKVECIGQMWVDSVWTMAELVAELRPGEVRLVYHGCHALHTAAQWKAGMWARKAEVQAMIDHVMDDEEDGEDEDEDGVRMMSMGGRGGVCVCE